MLEDFFQEHTLNEQEQMIFLALLKEEYGGSDESIRDMNSLIALVSSDDYEKIKIQKPAGGKREPNLKQSYRLRRDAYPVWRYK